MYKIDKVIAELRIQSEALQRIGAHLENLYRLYDSLKLSARRTGNEVQVNQEDEDEIVDR